MLCGYHQEIRNDWSKARCVSDHLFETNKNHNDGKVHYLALGLSIVLLHSSYGCTVEVIPSFLDSYFLRETRTS